MQTAGARALARRALRQERVRTWSFAAIFGLVAYANSAGYSGAYPTVKERLGFARSFSGDGVFRLFYGYPRDLLTVGGYSAWRIGGFFSIVAAAWGLLAAASAMRGEEETGRAEIVLAGPLRRGQAFAATVAALAAGGLVLSLATLAGFLAGGLPAGESAVLALTTVGPGIVFVGVGALTSQIAPSRRIAGELGAAVLAVSLLLRTVADTASGLGWLRWLTPLGWSEEVHAFTGARPAAFIPMLVAMGLLLFAAGTLALRRDIGSGLLPSAESHPPRERGLGSPLALGLREQRTTLSIWIAGTALYGAIVGGLSNSLNASNIPAALQRELRQIGIGSITTPTGAIGFYFLFFVLGVSLYACSQVASARREEAEGRLETLLSEPLQRHRWLAGRMLMTLGGAAAVALTAGIATWAVASIRGAGVPLAKLLEASANCLPLALMFAGLGFLALALLPRAAAGIAYGLVALAFVWELFGSLLGAPHWIVEATPFQHVALVPSQPFRVGAAALMVFVALAGSALAVGAFARRDLTGD